MHDSPFRLEIESQIGAGGFCTVHRCKALNSEQRFALKRLEKADDLECVSRFQREVRLLAQLNHPNIVRVVARHLDSRPFCYVMPLYRTSLSEELDDVVGDESRIIPIFTAIVNAVEYAHINTVIHRDLKPLNVLMNNDNDVVVSDFGIGRRLDAASTRDTKSGFRMGSLLYMPPEQFTDVKRADERSDVFALGKILFELYSGRLTSPYHDLSTAPPAIRPIVSKCTQDDPNRRFQHVGDLKAAWLNLVDASIQEMDLERLKQLSLDFSAQQTVGTKESDELLNLLMKYQDDSDVLHECVMQIHPNVVHLMYEGHADEVKGIIQRFTNNASGQGWSFEYTDRIGNRCKALYQLFQDYEIRSLLLVCIMIVGIDHNRWHLYNIFRQLMYAPKRPGEVEPLAERLRACTDFYRERAAGIVDLEELPPILREALET